MPNALADAQSLYLRQHADNPVDWVPWGPAALERARRERRPILLSIGYSACHWCHVMARESFADPGVAAALNAGFVCIKVDREERPDLDDLYMQAVQAFTGGAGGWPLTAFLTPEGVPFFAGTYFPPEPAHGLPSFGQVIAHAERTFAAIERGEVDLVAQVRAFYDEALAVTGSDAPEDWLGPVVAAADAQFDREHGGPKGAPRFPPHGALAALLVDAALTRSPASLAHVTRALHGMIRGGLYDHLSGGFARYSVDGTWTIPHFEKMLYDSAQLAPLLARAGRLAEEPAFVRVAHETLAFLERELATPTGGFAAALDADTEGEEGRFYVFSPQDLSVALGDAGPRAAALLGVTDEGTFEHGRSVLRLEQPLESLPDEDRRFLVDHAFPALRALRATRPAPRRDDKVVTAWNGLAIQAFAQVATSLGEPSYARIAARAARAILDHARPGGRLHRVHDEAGARVPAFLDDHANLLGGLLDLWEATWDPAWLAEARAIADAMLALFDDGGDALAYVGNDAEPLIGRSARLIGGPEPAGNGAAALHLLRLHELTDHAPYLERVDRILRVYAPLLARAPLALGPELIAGHWRARGGLRIGITGAPEAATPLIAELRRRGPPLAVTAYAPAGAPAPVPFLVGRDAEPGSAMAYVCEGFTCRLPTSSPDELGAQIGALTRRRRATGPTIHAPSWSTHPQAWIGAEDPPSLASLRGRVVVLDFWTLCCVNCHHVLPELARVERALAGQPVDVIGVHSAKFPYEQQREAVGRAVAERRITHPVLLDPDHDLWSRYAVRGWPTIVVIDPTGRIAWQRSGEVTAQELLDATGQILDQARASGTLAEATGEGGDAPGESDRATPSPSPTAAPQRTPSRGLLRPGKLRVRPGPAGDELIVADSGHHQIARFALDLDQGWPILRPVARYGSGDPGLADGSAEAARFTDPRGLAVHDEVVYVADPGNHTIRAIDLSSGHVSTVAGTGELGRGVPTSTDPRLIDLRSPWDLDLVDGVMFVAMAGAHQLWVLQVDEGRMMPFAGTGAEGHIDGPCFEGQLAQPSAVRCWGDRVYFVDSETSSVRALDLREATLGTLVGEGLFDWGDVDGGPEVARLQHPLGLAVDDEGLLIADTYNHKLKRLDPSSLQIRTVAGGPGTLAEPGGVARWRGFALLADTHHDRIAAVNLESGEVRAVEVRGA